MYFSKNAYKINCGIYFSKLSSLAHFFHSIEIFITQLSVSGNNINQIFGEINKKENISKTTGIITAATGVLQFNCVVPTYYSSSCCAAS